MSNHFSFVRANLFVWVTFLHFSRDFEQQILGVNDIAWNAV
jgi:hypothetical protein